jgi:hypothetical protein
MINGNERLPHFGAKILKQLSKRGWTSETVLATIQKPARTAPTKDTRYNPDGTQKNDLATVYYRSDGHYVICNDLSQDIVQVSDTTDSNWVDPLNRE